jgi:transposase InsO family protein
LLLRIISELRAEHPGVAARQLYWILKPERIGRDKFEALCFRHGFKLPRNKNRHVTTDSRGVIRFPNLLMGLELTGVNQAWASDITYYRIGDRFYFLTFIIDLFSRVIVGHQVSKRLLTNHSTIPALQKAVKVWRPSPGLIFHSDGGGQYYYDGFLKLTQELQIKNSMCDVAYENPHAERINGTIKNQYLRGYKPSTFESLVQQTERAVRNYNYVKPHSSLKKKTPMEYVKSIPAGGSPSPIDNFCDSSTTHQQHQKNGQLATGSTYKSLTSKKVNVF